MEPHHRALLLDDDPDALALLRHLLAQRFPDMTIVTRSVPKVDPGFDLYFLDNDFHGRSCAGELAEAARSSDSSALIVAFSAKLETATLKRLINAGCDWVCDKSQPDDLRRMLEMTTTFVEQGRLAAPSTAESAGFCSTVRAISELIRQWNQRLNSTSPGSGHSRS